LAKQIHAVYSSHYKTRTIGDILATIELNGNEILMLFAEMQPASVIEDNY
jgi:hypothetical protein